MLQGTKLLCRSSPPTSKPVGTSLTGEALFMRLILWSRVLPRKFEIDARQVEHGGNIRLGLI